MKLSLAVLLVSSFVSAAHALTQREQFMQWARVDARARYADTKAWLTLGGPLQTAINSCGTDAPTFSAKQATVPTAEATQRLCDEFIHVPEGTRGEGFSQTCAFEKFTPCQVEFTKYVEDKDDGTPRMAALFVHCELTAVLGIVPKWFCRGSYSAVPAAGGYLRMSNGNQWFRISRPYDDIDKASALQNFLKLIDLAVP